MQTIVLLLDGLLAIGFRWRFLVFLSCLALILWGVFRPTSLPDLFHHSDKWIHLLALGSFTLVTIWTFTPRRLWPVSLLLLLFAVLLEVAQGLLQSHRQFDVWDALGNALGVIVTSFLVWLLNIDFNLKRKSSI